MADEMTTMDDNESYNFRQLMDTLYEHKDIIVTIPEGQEQELRDGLQDRKAKDNVRLKKEGILPITDTLSFLAYPAVDKNNRVKEGQSCVRIKLLPRRSIDIISMEVPTDDL